MKKVSILQVFGGGGSGPSQPRRTPRSVEPSAADPPLAAATSASTGSSADATSRAKISKGGGNAAEQDHHHNHDAHEPGHVHEHEDEHEEEEEDEDEVEVLESRPPPATSQQKPPTLQKPPKPQKTRKKRPHLASLSSNTASDSQAAATSASSPLASSSWSSASAASSAGTSTTPSGGVPTWMKAGVKRPRTVLKRTGSAGSAGSSPSDSCPPLPPVPPSPTIPSPSLHLPPQAAGSPAPSAPLWSDKHSPRSSATLTVHGPTVQRVREWLAEAVGSSANPSSSSSTSSSSSSSSSLPTQSMYARPRKRLLILSGRPGAGKSATLRVLAQELGLAVVEWNDTYGQSPFRSWNRDTGPSFADDPRPDVPYSSHLDQFGEFLHSGAFPQLGLAAVSRPSMKTATKSEEKAGVGGSGRSGPSPQDHMAATDSGGIFWDAPRASGWPDALREKEKGGGGVALADSDANTPSNGGSKGGGSGRLARAPPVVQSRHEPTAARGNDDGQGKAGRIVLIESLPTLRNAEVEAGFRGILLRHIAQSGTAPMVLIFSDIAERNEASMALEKLFSKEIMHSSSVECIEFNPVTERKIVKRLQDISKEEKVRVTPAELEAIGSCSNGDLRRAINDLQLRTSGRSWKSSASQCREGQSALLSSGDTRYSSLHAIAKLLHWNKGDADVAGPLEKRRRKGKEKDRERDKHLTAEDVLHRCDMNLEAATAFLQYNCVDFFSEDDHLASCLDLFSFADTFINRLFSTAHARDHGDAVFPEQYIASISSRAVASTNGAPNLARLKAFKPVTKPRVYEVHRERDRRREKGLQRLRLVANETAAHPGAVTDVLPFLSLLDHGKRGSSSMGAYLGLGEAGGAMEGPDSGAPTNSAGFQAEVEEIEDFD